MSITLKDYVKQRGVGAVAALCRVTPATIYNWTALKHYPPPHLATLLIEDSMRLLTFESIYSQYVHANYELIVEHKKRDVFSRDHDDKLYDTPERVKNFLSNKG